VARAGGREQAIAQTRQRELIGAWAGRADIVRPLLRCDERGRPLSERAARDARGDGQAPDAEIDQLGEGARVPRALGDEDAVEPELAVRDPRRVRRRQRGRDAAHNGQKLGHRQGVLGAPARQPLGQRLPRQPFPHQEGDAGLVAARVDRLRDVRVTQVCDGAHVVREIPEHSRPQPRGPREALDHLAPWKLGRRAAHIGRSAEADSSAREIDVTCLSA
jgi:hypothetical protein